jgi:hypothetical protein
MKTATALAVSWLVIAGVLSMFVAIPQRAAAQTITVTNPSSGSVWYASSTYTITWTWSGSVGANVKIEYDFWYYSTPTVIVASTSNDGSYTWTVPSIIDSHTDYFIRIWDLSDLTVYDDSAFFEIVGGGSGSGTISVTAPTILTTWYTGSTYDITWSTTGSVGPNVRIEYSEFPCVLCTPVTITTSTPAATGRYSWAIPTSLAAGAYTITVTDTSNANIHDDNGYFTIRAGSNPMLIIAIIAIIAIVLIVIVLAVVLAMRKKKAAALPPQANIPVAPPATQYAPPQYPQYPPQYQTQYPPQQQAAQSQAGATKMCINCGKSIPADFTFCIHCGGRT